MTSGENFPQNLVEKMKVNSRHEYEKRKNKPNKSFSGIIGINLSG